MGVSQSQKLHVLTRGVCPMAKGRVSWHCPLPALGRWLPRSELFSSPGNEGNNLERSLEEDTPKAQGIEATTLIQRASFVAQLVKNPPSMWETWV